MIIVSGFNVYPNEIEDVVSSFEGIVECAVWASGQRYRRVSEAIYVVDGSTILTLMS